MSVSKFRLLFWSVLLLALLLRLGAVVAVRPWSEHYQNAYLIYDPVGYRELKAGGVELHEALQIYDPLVYHELAQIFRKDGITEEFRNIVAIFAPGYPILLGFIYKLFGTSVIPPLIANVLFGVLTCAFLMIATLRAFSERAAIIAGVLFAFHPHSIRFTVMLYSETLFMLITSVFILGLVYIQQSDKRWVWGLVITTLAAALGAFSRISMLYFSVLAVLIWVLSSRTNWRLAVHRFLLFAVFYLICLSPWMIYNKIHHGTFRLSVSGEYNLLVLVVGSAISDDLDTFGVVRGELMQSAFERARQDGVNNPFEMSKYFLEPAIKKISENPARLVLSQLEGVLNFWIRPVQASSSRVAKLTEGNRKTIYYIYCSYIFQTALLAAWIALFFVKELIPRSWKFLSVIAVIYFAFAVGNAAYSRFFLHALPYILPVAAVNLVSFYDWLRKSALNRADPTISR